MVKGKFSEKSVQTGFSLVEMMAAVVLLGLLVVPLFTLLGSVNHTDVSSARKIQAIGLASAMMEMMHDSSYHLLSSFTLTSTVQGAGSVDQNLSIRQVINVPASGQSSGWQPLRYISGNDTGMAYKMDVNDMNTRSVRVIVQVQYSVGPEVKVESLTTIFRK